MCIRDSLTRGHGEIDIFNFHFLFITAKVLPHLFGDVQITLLNKHISYDPIKSYYLKANQYSIFSLSLSFISPLFYICDLIFESHFLKNRWINCWLIDLFHCTYLSLLFHVLHLFSFTPFLPTLTKIFRNWVKLLIYFFYAVDTLSLIHI